MTVRELLLHTSGMSSHCEARVLAEKSQKDVLASGQIVELIGKHGPECRCCFSERQVGSVPVLWSYCALDMNVETFTIGDRRLTIYVKDPKIPPERKKAALALTAEAAMKQAKKKRLAKAQEE